MTHKILLIGACIAAAACNNGEEGTDTGTEPTRTETIAALTADEAAGMAIYDENCALCHGADGTGGIGSDLTASAFNETESIDIVIEGEGSMPAFGNDLTDQEIKDVVAYTLTF